MAAVSFSRLLAPSSLPSSHASASSSASSQASSDVESFNSPFWKGFVACGVAKLICSSRQGFLGRTGLNKRCGKFSDVNPSLKACADVFSSTVSTSKETDESLWGDFCPLYSSRDAVTFLSKPFPVRTICMSATKDKDILNSIGIDGLSDSLKSSVRTGRVKRSTKETNVDVFIGLDGNGCCECDTGIPFLDHMLDQLASHGLFDLIVKAKGDIHIDDHHTNEDVALALGTALLQALGDRKGIYRFGDFSAPLDEALIHVALDLSGRPHLGYQLEIPTDRVGTYDTQLVEHFFQSIVNTSGMTLHIRQISGRNSHHIIEATFKAFAKALRQAIEYDLRRKGTIPSSKGVLSRS